MTNGMLVVTKEEESPLILMTEKRKIEKMHQPRTQNIIMQTMHVYAVLQPKKADGNAGQGHIILNTNNNIILTDSPSSAT